MAALPSDRVSRGFWIDSTRGPVLGAIITTSSSDANIIVAVLSVLVAFTGSHLWDLIAFIRFWTGASNQPRSALHHQLQILVRNITSPGAFLLEAVLVGWSWRHRGALSSLATVVGLAIICSAGFLVAGIFVSQIVSTSDLEVLAHSGSCGWISWRNETTDLNRDYQQTIFNQAVTYVQTCYNKTGPLSQCNIYVKRAVPIQEMTHTGCPFPGICTNNSAVRLDTGLVDSNDVFGINTDSDLRVRMQRVFTCAPIDADRYFTTRPIPPEFSRRYYDRDPLPEEQLFEWFLGPMTGSLRSLNSTVQQSDYKVMFSTGIDLTPRAYYVPADDKPLSGWHNSTFDLIPELRREDADTHIIIFHNNALRFFTPNNDPIFAAHTEKQVLFDDSSNITMYIADKPASVLGCAEQMRFCFAQGGCTQLLGAGSAYVRARKIAPTSQQNATLRYLFFQTPNFYEAPRAPMLVTRNAVSFQLGIPPNQWEAEVKAWVKFLVAVTQTTITHIAAGPGIVRPDFDQLAEPLDWSGLCSRQRMGAPDGYSNINVLALALVIALSGIIILTNLSLVPTLRYLHRRHGLFQQVMVSWTQESILQVQRKAYEGAGYSKWLNRDAAVPITNDNMLIPGLGAEEFAARIGGMALVAHDARQPEGSLPSPGAFHPPLPSPLSSNPHLPLAYSTGNPEAADVLEEVERQNTTNENPNLLDMRSSIVSGT
ncbi:hypothetical protein B0O99DRAFT_724969 [Bisporella sp. PMI_857]|nr:hypothetical protein B0O99DRAFT_724969 [Bisporella sp. PMI_857]